MRTRLFGRRGAGLATARHAMTALWISAAIVVLVDSVSGQGTGSQAPLLQPPTDTSSKPWTGKRLPDGQPEVQGGIWRTPGGGTRSLTNPGESNGIGGENQVVRRVPSRIVDPPDGLIPYQPWALARRNQQAAALENPTRPEHVDNQARCLTAIPRLYYYVSNYTIVQPPGMVVFLWEIYHNYRVIRLDGSPHSVAPNMKLYWGDAIGHWEGNTLVVDTTNLNGKVRLTTSGDFFTDKVHLTERMTFVDADTMIYEVTIDDPTVYTRPWTMRIGQKRLNPQELLDARGQTDAELWEEGCVEGSLDRPSITPAYLGQTTNPNP